MEMKTMKLLIVEDDENECIKFEEVVNKKTQIEIVGITNSSVEAIKLVKVCVPQAIILDLELNKGQGSGFEFIKEIQNMNLETKPIIVVTTNVYTDSVYNYLHENKVDFIFHKKQEKYCIENVINTVLLLNGYNVANNKEDEEDINEKEEKAQQISDKINKELDLIGVGTHLQGRKYLHDSILYIIMNEDENNKISIIQYLTSKYKKANSTISRAMQNAILYAWRISSIDDLEVYYTAKINYETGVPTPTEFIYYYVEKIRKEI